MSESVPDISETKKLTSEEKARALLRARFMPQENITPEQQKLLDSYEEDLDREEKEEERIKNELYEAKIEKLAVSELESPLKEIILGIKERIDRGDYSLIIGDDASGRIPALILGRFIQDISKDNGHKVPRIVFIPGKIWTKEGWDEYPEDPMDDVPGAYYRRFSDDIDEYGLELQSELEKNLSKYGADKNKRILIVTEIVQTGDTLGWTHLLTDLGYTIDIATILNDYRGSQGRLEQLKNIEIIDGGSVRSSLSSNARAPVVYNRKGLSGVEKHGYINNTEVIKRDNPAVQAKLNRIREDAYKLSQGLEEWYKSTDKDKDNNDEDNDEE